MLVFLQVTIPGYPGLSQFIELCPWLSLDIISLSSLQVDCGRYEGGNNLFQAAGLRPRRRHGITWDSDIMSRDILGYLMLHLGYTNQLPLMHNVQGTNCKSAT
jgi:hypothetical protein